MKSSNLAKTIDTYNRSAKQFTQYFRSVNPARIKDIKSTFALLGLKDNPAVLEIGCADGRDAEAILEFTNNYHGFDISNELIKLAQKNIPTAEFSVADARSFNYIPGFDIVFSFASLLHVNRDELDDIFEKIWASLNEGGVFYLSLKKGDRYREYVKKDEFGERLFYLYTLYDIEALAAQKFKIEHVYYGFVTSPTTQWFDVILKKSNSA